LPCSAKTFIAIAEHPRGGVGQPEGCAAESDSWEAAMTLALLLSTWH
jgi:hypothetical protein